MNTFLKVFLVIVLQIVIINSIEGSGSNVVKLDSSNFKTEVINSDDLWLVEFFGNHFL